MGGTNPRWFAFGSLVLAACGCATLPQTDRLAWDSVEKTYTARLGENSIQVTFTVTNVSNSEVIIQSVTPSCGCTTVRLPENLWRLGPGASIVIEASVDLSGKQGRISKSITVESSAGPHELIITIDIPEDSRTGNRRIAQQDRQSVFQRSECAECHGAPKSGAKKGAELFAAVCSNCHESKNRAPEIPDLASLRVVTSHDFWQLAVAKGKAGTMMPAFAQSEGGPLDDEQVRSLVDYLGQRFRPPLPIESR